ncbi:MAG: hypothetical protein SGI77_19545 [Pirellulaceae bacterium]|nr:hypothetical protein [Pirellulaceae bacterium]
MNETELKELFNERAAIREFEGGIPRDRAEAEALGDLVQRYGPSVRRSLLAGQPPESVRAIPGVRLGSDKSFATLTDTMKK